MLGIKTPNSAKNISLLIIVALIIVVIVSRNSQTLVRAVVGQEINLKTAGFSEVETEHYKIRYTSADQEYVDMIGVVAENAFSSVCREFERQPVNKTTIVVYPNSESLARSFGWDKDEKAMGVYWGGSIRILSPREWISGSDWVDQFASEGPMVHEFAHLMVDEITRGNYNRWWTEGIAQYIEKKITGFEFADPFAERQELEYYPLSVLEKNFDKIDQQIAYWESLKVVEYIAQQYGEDSLFSILEELGRGKTMSRALTGALGVDYKAFEHDFYQSMGKQ